MKERSEKISVVGSGLMGRGIAQSIASAGYEVAIVDLEQKILDGALKQMKSSLDQLVEAGVVEDADEIIDRITMATDLAAGVRGSSLVIEAIYENPAAKREVFHRIEKAVDAQTIISSNTSSIPIATISEGAKHPERILGTHFWNPPQLMPAVEVVRGEATTDDVVEKAVKILRSAGKTPVVVRKDVPGQIAIRILYAMIREATWLVENDVATAEDVDIAIKEALGSRLEILGPLELADLSGVDLVNNVAKGLYKSLDSSQGPQKLIQDMIAKNELGVKTGRGFYDWKNDRNAAETIQMRDRHLIGILKEKQSTDSKE